MVKLDEEKLESPISQPKWQIWILLDADVIDPNRARLSAVQYVTGVAQINTHTRLSVYIYIYIEYITYMYIDNAF